MLISNTELKKRIERRLPTLTKEEISIYFKSVIDLLIYRFMENYPVIIDNFGILSRKKTKPRKISNINTGESMEIISETVSFRPSYEFLEFFKDKKNRENLRRKIIKRSKQAIKKNKNKYLI